ncbi:MAG: aminotransferase class I/II-fold pyridoxal phosphate-dependent enzyme [Acidobacteria bacterium]|nr:aminotransferase class I/II-fold pyridoxal phosphate-dependent enzyme [Acidobacteriota bacterium]
MIDLRSDTVTKPTPEMRAAMAAAEVGDDVYGEDPTINRLEQRAAEIFEKEAALFVASGTMGNQIAVKVHTRPGQEVIAEERSHVFNFELGMAGILSGVTFRTVRSSDGSGHPTWNEISQAYRPGDDHEAATALIWLENSHNMGGGTVMNAEHCAEICENAHKLGICVHIDGARIFNAAVASGSSVVDLTRHADSVQFCLSKGLGAPVGSILVGSAKFIAESRQWRKRLGGGMRQAGIVGAAGLLALEQSPQRLGEDHVNARALAEGLAQLDGIGIDPEHVRTNIVIFDVTGTGKTQADICRELRGHDILASGWDEAIRMVTHRNILPDDIPTVLQAMRQVLN